MKIGKKAIIHTQYYKIGQYMGRNVTSCGLKKWGYDRKNKRLNLWPLSIWFY